MQKYLTHAAYFAAAGQLAQLGASCAPALPASSSTSGSADSTELEQRRIVIVRAIRASIAQQGNVNELSRAPLVLACARAVIRVACRPAIDEDPPMCLSRLGCSTGTLVVLHGSTAVLYFT